MEEGSNSNLESTNETKSQSLKSTKRSSSPKRDRRSSSSMAATRKSSKMGRTRSSMKNTTNSPPDPRQHSLMDEEQQFA